MSHQYFNEFNYSLANEDTWMELKSAKQDLDSIFAVCGSGSRSVPLLALNPKELHVTDFSLNQLRLFQLRLSANKALTHEEYLGFLGYTKMEQKVRTKLFDKLVLKPEERTYWLQRKEVWTPDGVLYLGRWEKHFMMLGRLFLKTTFSQLDPIFAASNMEEQKLMVKKYWKRNLFNYYVKIVLNSYVSNKLLYKGHYAGSNELRTSSLTPAQLVSSEFNYVFDETWARANYFLQMIFLNEVKYAEAFPAEADKKIFEAVKQSQSKVFYHQKNLLDLAKVKPHNFYSLSDTFSYLTDEEAQSFFQNLPIQIKKDSKIFIRSFMRTPKTVVDTSWLKLEQEMKEAKKNDCTRMYDFLIMQKV